MSNAMSVKNLLVITLMLITFQCMADNPGYEKTFWKPERVVTLTQQEVNDLNSDKCLIPSYRSNDEYTPQRKIAEPDKHDYFALVRGEFAVKGQKDLLVFCKSSENNSEYLRVIWGGKKQCSSKLFVNETSRFMKKHGTYNDYAAGTILYVYPATKTLTMVDKIFDEYEKFSKETQYGDEFKYWRLNKSDTPIIEHDSIAFSTDYISMFYCAQKDWIQLLDVYTSATD